MDVFEPDAIHQIPDGIVKGKAVESYTKMYHEVESLYAEKREDDPVVYEVFSYSKGEDAPGNLKWGLTILKPVYSHGECNMTKGHFHEDKTCAEFYFGIAGEGLLLLMNEAGDTWAEKVFAGSLHHIEGIYAHRLVNTGEEELKVGACWPASAGHNYQAVEAREFGYRVFRKNNQIEYKKRLE